MKVTVIGAGYVDLVAGACLAEMGNHVVCVDVDEQNIRVLKDGGIPIHEPARDELVRRNVAGSRLEFSTDLGAAIGHLTILMIAVCPPHDEDGAADLLYVLCVLSAARGVGQRMADYKVVVDKSTVPVGAADTVRHAVTAELARDCGLLWETCAPSAPRRAACSRDHVPA